MLPARLERSCVRCALGIDSESPQTLIYTEDWSSEQDLSRHIRSDRFVQLMLLMETAACPPELEFLFVSGVRGLDFVERVRSTGGST